MMNLLIKLKKSIMEILERIDKWLEEPPAEKTPEELKRLHDDVFRDRFLL